MCGTVKGVAIMGAKTGARVQLASSDEATAAISVMEGQKLKEVMADAVSGGMMDSVDMPADTKPDTPAMERSQTMPAPTESNSSNADPELDIMYQGRTAGIEGPPSENLYVK